MFLCASGLTSLNKIFTMLFSTYYETPGTYEVTILITMNLITSSKDWVCPFVQPLYIMYSLVLVFMSVECPFTKNRPLTP